MLLRPLDCLILVIAGATTVVSAFFIYSGKDSEKLVRINAQGEKTSWEYPLDAEETVFADGPIGRTLIEIKGGSVRILSSPCENKTCISMGAIDGDGRFIACLPNRVIVTIEGGGGTQKKDKVDAVTW
jgi:hypothetical protein